MYDATTNTVIALSTAMTANLTATQKATKAQEALEKAALAVAKAAKTIVAGFDELHVSTATTPNDAKSSSKSSSKSGGGSVLFDWSILEKWAKRALEALKAIIAKIKAIIEPIWAQWKPAFTQFIAKLDTLTQSIQKSVLALWHDGLEPLITYIVNEFVPKIQTVFLRKIMPIFTDVLGTAFAIFEQTVQSTCVGIINKINGILLPFCKMVEKTITGVFETVGTLWNFYGKSLMTEVQTAFKNLSALLGTFFNTAVMPFITQLMAQMDTLWDSTLRPLFAQLCSLILQLVTLVLQLWNDTLAPFLQYLADTFSPLFAVLFQNLGTVLMNFLTSAGTVVGSIMQALQGLIAFLTGAFSADWALAWQGMQTVFANVWGALCNIVKGTVNTVIDLVNAMINGITAGINCIIGAINDIHITIPKWVPAYGGMDYSPSLQPLTAPQIPRLAQGAVIPPNAAFLAMLGDQKNGTNLEAPESLIRKIVREESVGNLQLEAHQPVELLLDGEVIYQTMLHIRANRGAEIGGIFANAI